MRAFTSNERPTLLAKALAATDPQVYTMTAVLLVCGLRGGELCGLAFDDAVDLEVGTLTIKRVVIEADGQVMRDKPKTDHSKRTIQIPLELVKLLRAQKAHVQEQLLKWDREYQREPLLVFPDIGGAPLAPAKVTQRMRKILRAAKVKGAQPCLGWRHTAATVLLDAGQSIPTVQARLGHASPRVSPRATLGQHFRAKHADKRCETA